MLELQLEMTNLNDALALSGDAHVTVEGTIHGGTEVHLGPKVWRTAEQRPHTVSTLNGDGDLTLQ